MGLTSERGTFAQALRSAVSFASLYWGGGLMPISNELKDEYLEFECPLCPCNAEKGLVVQGYIELQLRPMRREDKAWLSGQAHTF